MFLDSIRKFNNINNITRKEKHQGCFDSVQTYYLKSNYYLYI